jgi:hypothetical protein
LASYIAILHLLLLCKAGARLPRHLRRRCGQRQSLEEVASGRVGCSSRPVRLKRSLLRGGWLKETASRRMPRDASRRSPFGGCFKNMSRSVGATQLCSACCLDCAPTAPYRIMAHSNTHHRGLLDVFAQRPSVHLCRCRSCQTLLHGAPSGEGGWGGQGVWGQSPK